MQVQVSLLPSMRTIDATTDVAVVIDVLRATSVMTRAIAEGATSIMTCQEIEQARNLQSDSLPSEHQASELQVRPLLCGERECRPIEGFDLGNSPAEYTSRAVANRNLILTTTNGTRAIAVAQQARQMIIASFLNLSAVTERVKSAERLHLVCAGTNGEITAEDTLLAGAIIDRLQHDCELELCGDDAILAHELWRGWCPSEPTADLPTTDVLTSRLAQTRGGRNLIQVGFEADLRRCAEIDSINIVPERIGISPPAFGLQLAGASSTFNS